MATHQQTVSASRPRQKAAAPVPRPDRRFYAQTQAFGRFGIRWFDPQIMPVEHFHGHIELNWLTAGGMDYVIDGRPLSIPAERVVMFWAGIPHQTVALDTGPHGDSRQCNVYLPLDSFLHMPNLGRLTETMMGGGVVMLQPGTLGADTLQRWYQNAIAALSVYAARHEAAIESIDINPFLVLPRGHGALSLDALIVPRADAA